MRGAGAGHHLERRVLYHRHARPLGPERGGTGRNRSPCGQACGAVRNWKPKIAFLSHSNFGSYITPSARKMRRATELLKRAHPQLEADGEMHGDPGAVAGDARARAAAHLFPKASPTFW
ncbi:MAG: phosphate acyltransferase [Xanthobacteraceae bacterium]